MTRLPPYLWSLLSLMIGLVMGGVGGDRLESVASLVHLGLALFIQFVPALIFVALGPAVSKIAAQGRGGRLAFLVVGWYSLTSLCAGLMGVLISGLMFEVSFATGDGDFLSRALEMLALLGSDVGPSWPLIAIVAAVLLGLSAGRSTHLQQTLDWLDRSLERSIPLLSKLMPLLVFLLGVTLGVRLGTTETLAHYLRMTLYTALLCGLWFGCYLLIVMGWLAKQPLRRLLRDYYLPTAIVAAGTCSSLATLPVNLQNAKRYGADPSIAGFVIPLGCVINMDTSALAYVAYAPFMMTIVFELPITWEALLVAWPAIVLFTIAAPGLPAGMGTALWSSTLFSSLMGLEGADQATFVSTWIALSGGIPDMMRTATNATCDGFTAILFSQRKLQL